jgi:hypothetical protein
VQEEQVETLKAEIQEAFMEATLRQEYLVWLLLMAARGLLVGTFRLLPLKTYGAAVLVLLNLVLGRT